MDVVFYGRHCCTCEASHYADGLRLTENQSSCSCPWPTTRKANSRSKVRVGTRHRSIAAIASAWLRRNVRQLCDGGPRRPIMCFETVDSATRIQASAARRGSAERPTTGCPCSFDG